VPDNGSSCALCIGHDRALLDDRLGARQLMNWTRLLKRVFDIDMRHCPNRGTGALMNITAILRRPVRVTIAPGAQPDTVLLLHGQVLHEFGGQRLDELYVRLQLTVPLQFDARQHALYEQLRQLKTEHPARQVPAPSIASPRLPRPRAASPYRISRCRRWHLGDNLALPAAQPDGVPMNRSTRITAVILLGAALAAPALAQTVKVTPLGGVDGEFCPQDRALVFEDPTGTRVLYDPGRTVAGADDPRLGKIDIVLVSHMHGDHIGNAHAKAPNSGTCDKPDVSVSAMPHSSAVLIAVAKKAKIVTGSEMPPFFAAKLKANGGNPADSVLTRYGGSVTIGGVRIATVTALHSNGVDPEFFGGELGRAMKEAGLAGDVGLANGYVLRFSNGLVVYLSGDTGITADQDLVVRGHYNAKLAVMNIGDGFTTGPVEAAYVMNELVKPTAVIASHANEVGTVNGKVRAGSKTEAFVKAAKMPVHVPLSGKTMEFDAAGKCTAGCGT